MRESAAFQAKWPGRCEVCGEEYGIGDWLHFVGVKTVAHDYCHSMNYEPPQNRDYERVEESYRVRGRRKHEKRCSSCQMIHAGECL